MITNATLLTITPPPTPTSGGGQVEGSPIASGVSVLLDAPTRAQLMAATNKVIDCTAMLFVPLAAATAIKAGSRVSVQLEGGMPASYQILHRIDQVLGGLSHAQCYCRGL